MSTDSSLSADLKQKPACNEQMAIGGLSASLLESCKCSDSKIEALKALLDAEKDIRSKLVLQYQIDRDGLSRRSLMHYEECKRFEKRLKALES